MDETSRNESQRLMEKYNFDSPIKVTIVVEEDQPDQGSTCNLHASKLTSSPLNNVSNKFNTSKAETESVLREMLSSGDKNAPRNNKQKKSSDYPWHFLYPVIENLVHIIKYHYHNIKYVDKQTEHYKKLISEFLLFKHHFFNLSYSTTVAVLLPQEKNERFLISFIQKIIQIAKQSSWYEVTFKRLCSLLKDLLNWTKLRKKYLETKFDLNKSTAKNVAPSVVSHPPSSIYKNIPQQVLWAGKKKSSIETTSLPEKNPIVNNLRQKEKQNNPPFIPRSLNPTQENNIPSNIVDTSIVNNVKKTVLLSTGPPNREITISVDQHILDNLNYQNATKTMYQASETEANINCKAKRRKLIEIQDVQNYHKVSSHASTRNSHYQNHSYPANNVTNVMNNNSFNSRTEGYFINTDTTIRSSISRDSGFSSPLHQQSPNFALNGTFEETTPILTDVTSTNSNAVNITEGNCKVCRTATKYKCDSSFQQYYCSYLCQDWQIHQMDCNIADLR